MNEEYPTKYLEKILKIDDGELKLVDEGGQGPFITLHVLNEALEFQTFGAFIFEDVEWFNARVTENNLPEKGTILKVQVRQEYYKEAKRYYSHIEKVLEILN